MQLRSLIALICLPALALAGNVRYARVGGGTGTGVDSTNAWSLAYALDGAQDDAKIAAGDTIYCYGGTYSYTNTLVSTLDGSSGNPIVVRNYNNQRVTIQKTTAEDGEDVMWLEGSYTWYWGLEFACSATSIPSPCQQRGVVGYGPSNKIINCIAHDNATSGFNVEKDMTNGEVYGCLSYYNGRQTESGNYGYAIYAQNDDPSVMWVEAMIGCHNYGNYTGHFYGSSNCTDYFRIKRNVFFNETHPGTLLLGGGGHTSIGSEVDSNYLYNGMTDIWNGIMDLGWILSGDDMGVRTTVARDNRIMHGIMRINHGGTASNLTFTSNYNWGGTPEFTPSGSISDYPSNTWNTDATYPDAPTEPTANEYFILPNKYEAKRGHVVVYNWKDSNSVTLNLSTILTNGDSVYVYDAQNYYGAAIYTGVYSGPISVATTGTGMSTPVGVPSGRSTPTHTAKEFNAFIVKGTSNGEEELVAPRKHVPWRKR